MRKIIKRLNQKGFGHHFIIPVIVIVAVATVGTYILERSHAAELPTNASIGSSPTTFLVSGGAPNGVEENIANYRYYAVNSNGNCSPITSCQLTQSNGSLLGLGSGLFTPDIGASTSKQFTKVIGAKGKFGNGVRIYDVLSRTVTDLALNSTSDRSVQDPIYSPDGTKIAYRLLHMDSGPFPVNDIFTASADGTNITSVHSASQLTYQIRWQPSVGKRISYMAQQNPPGGLNSHWYAHIVDSNGQNDVTLGEAGGATANAWSYDGSLFAYEGNDTKIHIVDSSGNPVQTLSVNLLPSGDSMAFSPTGNATTGYSIVYTNNATQVVNTKTNKVTTLLNKAVENLRWLRDGRIAYFEGLNKFGGEPVKTILPDGTSPKTVITLPAGSDVNINYPTL